MRLLSRPDPRVTIILSTTVLIALTLGAGLPTVAITFQSPAKQNDNLAVTSKTIYPISEIPLAFGSEPLGITVGPKGNVWLAENNSTKIVEYFPSNQTLNTYPIPMEQPSMIWFMVFDRNGNLWFSNELQPYLWRFSPRTGQFANFTTGNQFVDPFGLAFDNFTNQIWFTSTYTDQIGYFALQGENAQMGELINATRTQLPSGPPRFGPTDILVGPRGNIFFSQPFFGNIIEYSPSKQEIINVWKLRPGTQAAGISLDNTLGTVWFANDASSLFGYVDENIGRSTEFATSPFEYLGATLSQPYWTSVTQNGTVWFNEYASNKIARYNSSAGILTEFAVPANRSTPLRFAIDNQRHVIWFTEFSGDNLGEISEDATCNCTVQLSTRNLILSSTSVSFYLKVVPQNNQSLGANPTPPVISGTFQTDGNLTGNLTSSYAVVNSSFYRVTLTRGPYLNPGNYSITVCPRITSSDNATTPGPVRQCATSLLTITSPTPSISRKTAMLQGTQPSRYADLVILLVAAASAFSITLYLRRGRPSSNASAAH